eukprot:123946_1
MNNKSIKKNKKKKKSKQQKKEEFMKMLSSFSQFTGNTNDNDDDDDDKQFVFNEKETREEYRKLIEPEKLKKKYITYYSFKIHGYNDNEIPPFEGDVNIGEENITMDEMIDSMVNAKRMTIRDPELKHEMDKKIFSYKQSK